MNHPSYPEIEFRVKPESGQMMVGESATLSWKVHKAEKIYLLQTAAAVSGILTVNWQQLGQKGQEVKSEDQLIVTPKTTTAYIIAAVGKGGRKAQSVILEVWQEKPKRGKAAIWYQEWEAPSGDWWLDPQQRFDEGVRHFVRCYGRDANITFTGAPRVVFTDEEATLTWQISCSDCADMHSGGYQTFLVEDLTRRSGTRVSSGASWGALPPACSLDMDSEADVGAVFGQGHYYWNIFADGSWGAADSATVQVMFMPHPQFDGCNAERRAAIEEALLDICRRLLDGCIRDNADLDAEVAAFSDGHIDRRAFWSRLLVELENINLTTFRCMDVDDDEWRGGRWEEYTNEIELHWSPSSSPAISYVILHELIHKSGFHSALLGHYERLEIEQQAHRVTESCL